MTAKLNAYITLIRPYQWIKNILLLAPLFFSGHINLMQLTNTAKAIFCFCLASSLGYILNDWMDRVRDKNHHQKCTRPFCSGAVSGRKGLSLSIVLALILVFGLYVFNLTAQFLIYLFSYLLLTGAYSLYLKHVVVLEIFIVSAGFVLRVIAGGAACYIVISGWLFLTTFFMSMLITVAKRKVEFDLLASEAHTHRESLKEYNSIFLYNYLWTLGGATIVVYAIYTVEKGAGLVYSVIPAAYGIVRFFLLMNKGLGGDPIKALFADVQLMITTLIFIGFIGIKIYFF